MPDSRPHHARSSHASPPPGTEGTYGAQATEATAHVAQKHRVAFYCSLMAWPKPSSGGVRQWALTLANGLVARGHTVDMLSEAPRDHFRDDPLLDARVGRVVLGKGWMARARLVSYLRNHPRTHLVAALNRYNLGAVMLRPLFGRGTMVTLTQHENFSADAAWKRPVKHRFNGMGIRRYFDRADAIVAVSHGVADDLCENWNVSPERVKVIYNPAFDSRFLEMSDAPAPHPWLADKPSPVIIAAGRLHVVKGFDILLQAFARLRARLEARLIILGEGPERKNLEALVSALGLNADVALPGRVSHVAPWFVRADCFALSSRREGFGNVLVEALAAGLPIVATRCPSGPDEILDQGRWGVLVDVGDIQQMAVALHQSLLQPRPVAARLMNRAREFSEEKAIESYLELWNAAARKQPP